MNALQFQEIVEEEIIELPTGKKRTKKRRKRTLSIRKRSFLKKQAISILGKVVVWLGKKILIPLIFIHSAGNYTGVYMPVNIQDNAIGPKTTVQETLVQISDTMAMDPKE